MFFAHLYCDSGCVIYRWCSVLPAIITNFNKVVGVGECHLAVEFEIEYLISFSIIIYLN